MRTNKIHHLAYLHKYNNTVPSRTVSENIVSSRSSKSTMKEKYVSQPGRLISLMVIMLRTWGVEMGLRGLNQIEQLCLIL